MSENWDILNGIQAMRTGANQALIQQGFGADGFYGTSPLLGQVTMILKADSSYDNLFLC